jgi:hypothetical protein
MVTRGVVQVGTLEDILGSSRDVLTGCYDSSLQFKELSTGVHVAAASFPIHRT